MKWIRKSNAMEIAHHYLHESEHNAYVYIFNVHQVTWAIGRVSEAWKIQHTINISSQTFHTCK